MIFRSESRFMWRDMMASMPTSVLTSFGDRRRHTAILNLAFISLSLDLASSTDSSSSVTATIGERGNVNNSSNVSTKWQEKPNEVKCSKKTCLEIAHISKMKHSSLDTRAVTLCCS